MSRRCWTCSAGERPHSVIVYERRSGGPIYVRVWDSTRAGGRGGWIRRSLGHKDRERARVYALGQAAKLRQGTAEVVARRASLAQLFAAYHAHRTPRKSGSERKADARRAELWTRVLGGDKKAERIILAEWQAFIEARRSGAIDARGRPVPQDLRRPVRNRTISADLIWLKLVLTWGTKWQDREGRYLLSESSVRGFELPREKNPRRPVATQDRYERLLQAADGVQMEVRWDGKRLSQRNYLRELLVLANGTGRRLSAICQLRFDDLRLGMGPYGSIRWRADTDKTGRETVVPIGPDVRSAIDQILRERPGLGSAPLLPSPNDPQKPISRHLARAWLQQAERLADLEPQQGSLWHAFRRKWATERKHLPDVDVAAAGGWRGVETLKLAYQQADTETMEQVVLEPKRLREAK